jgi:hypothetical protein
MGCGGGVTSMYRSVYCQEIKVGERRCAVDVHAAERFHMLCVPSV